MVTSDLPFLPTISWCALRVQTGDPSFPITLTGPARLVELFHWRRGKTSPGVWVSVHLPSQSRLEPEAIDWALFPLAEAQAEMQIQDARRGRYLRRRRNAA